uniref:WD_REPEATS_REGION domain-containing protein n=1 Tax=Rhabditophanes sp. KR3021 TaxID=114890 RepID=A0AC35U658_9BILA
MSSRKYNAPNNPYSLTISRSNFTSIASDRQGKFISLASDSKICLYRPNCQKTDAPLSVRKIPRLDINTMLFNDWNPNKIQLATVSGQFFDIFAIRESHLYHTRERSACPYNITDIDWCKYNPNLLAVSSQLHDTTVWDFRSIKVPAFRIYSVCGNKLAKFRNMNFRGDRQWIATAEDCFVRMYDFRHTKRPFNEVKVHDQRIIDMKWDNIEDDCLITTSHDKTIKFWDANNLYNPINVIRLEKHSPPVGNIFCSPTGQFYATIPKPYYSKDDKTLTIWKRPSQTTSFHFDFEGDMLQSGAWQFFDKQRNRLCFFDITKKGDFRRRFVHTIALGHEVNNVLKAPSVQLNIDRQLDYAVAADRSLGEKLCVMGDDRLQVLDDTFNVIEELEDQDITALWKAMKMYFDKCCEENNTKFKKTSTQNPMTHGVVELFLTKLINAGVYQIVAIASLIMSQLVIMEPVNRIPSFDVAEYEKTQFSSDSEDFDDSDDSSYVYESESDSDFYVKSQSTIPIKEEVKVCLI